MPRPPRHRGSSGGQSVFIMHVFEQRVVSEPSTHSALAQSFSPVQVPPAGVVPRTPGSQYTCCGSAAWHRVPTGQSSLLKHGHAFGTAHAEGESTGASSAIGAASTFGGVASSPQAARRLNKTITRTLCIAPIYQRTRCDSWDT